MIKQVTIEILQPIDQYRAVLLSQYEDEIEIKYPGTDLTRYFGGNDHIH